MFPRLRMRHRDRPDMAIPSPRCGRNLRGRNGQYGGDGNEFAQDLRQAQADDSRPPPPATSRSFTLRETDMRGNRWRDVDEGTHGISRHLIGWIGIEQWEEAVHVADPDIQPEIVVSWSKNHGHSAVE